MAGFLTGILTPAFIAGIVSLLVTNKNEKIRANRDFVTKAFDPARDDISAAVDAAVKYFPCAAADRTKIDEVQLLAAERGVRRSVTSILLLHEKSGASYIAAELSFDTFISELTGGNFQSSGATPDIAAAIRIADAGANLKAALLALRSEVLQSAISDDPLTASIRFVKSIYHYFRG